MSDTPDRITIPPGNFDDRNEQSQDERPPFKPLKTVDIQGLGKYEIGVPGTFDGKTFRLVARDEDGEDIPLISYSVQTEEGKRRFIPAQNERAKEFFGQHIDMDELTEQFAPELDSWIDTQLNK